MVLAGWSSFSWDTFFLVQTVYFYAQFYGSTFIHQCINNIASMIIMLLGSDPWNGFLLNHVCIQIPTLMLSEANRVWVSASFCFSWSRFFLMGGQLSLIYSISYIKLNVLLVTNVAKRVYYHIFNKNYLLALSCLFWEVFPAWDFSKWWLIKLLRHGTF